MDAVGAAVSAIFTCSAACRSCVQAAAFCLHRASTDQDHASSECAENMVQLAMCHGVCRTVTDVNAYPAHCRSSLVLVDAVCTEPLLMPTILYTSAQKILWKHTVMQ